MKRYVLNLIIILSLAATHAVALSEETKGLLPEVALTKDNEDKNQEKSFQSEVLITKTENKAIDTLKKIIKKNYNTPEEVSLLFRLAELYMRRSKSGRFFDLDQRFEDRLKKQGFANEKTQASLKDALKIYDEIQRRFPKFEDLDFVLFNSALARLQMKETEKAKSLFTQLIGQYQRSTLLPDALLELGEIYYNQQNFNTALEKFKQLEKYPKSKAYPYGLYKSAWCLYNMKNTDAAIDQLLVVVKQNPADSKNDRKYNLRKEALRDLTLFVGETLEPNEVYGFFEKITTPEELGEIIIALAGLYESHSRFKEISVFTYQFIKAHPLSSQAPKCYTKLIETNETLKLRPKVIENLTEMSQFCKKDKVDPTCYTEFRKVSLEISKKWWEIWLKNKNNAEFSALTEQAFENLLSTDTATQPDSKSRYAFAELLFQQSKFEQAAQNYELVSTHPNLDKALAHDSLYAALFSIEKILDKKESAAYTEKQKTLGIRYIKEFNTGEHANEIQYKLGYIAYKQNDYDLSLNYIKPLMTKATEEIKLKSEDLVLDIYNIKKDYVTIQKISQDILKRTSNPKREQALKKIAEESHYSQIQIDSKNLAVQKQIDLLVKFSEEHKQSKLAQDAYWQAISLAYSKGLDVNGANLSLSFIKQYPDDKRNLDALKEAAKTYVDSGNIKLAISTLKDLVTADKAHALQHQELICDLMKINSQLTDSRKCYKIIFAGADKSKKVEILSKMMKTFDNQNNSEYLEIQNQILSSNIEPFATEILINQAKKLLEKKDYTSAFNLSLKINSRPVDADIRAEARLIQAQILEQEFVSQSVKSRESKFSMVIAMKTEKMDKAFTAYSSAIKMSKSDAVQLRGLQGIDRVYSHFIDAISNMPMPETFSAADKKALKAELLKLTEPFAEKRKNNNAALKQISKLSSNEDHAIAWDEHSVENSVEPRVKYPDVTKLNTYYPNEISLKSSFTSRQTASASRCDSKNVSASSINACIQNKKFDDAEKLALQISSTKENRAIGLYYLALIADAETDFDKALWLLEKSGQIENSSLVNYAKAKALYSVKDMNSSLELFGKLFDIRAQLPEAQLVYAIKCFSDGDYLKASDEFSRLSAEQIYNYGVDLLHVDSILLKGDSVQALKTADTYTALSKAERVEMLIEQARIYEHLANNNETASVYYQKALSKSNNPDQQEWLKKKIEYIKNNKNNQLTSNVGG